MCKLLGIDISYFSDLSKTFETTFLDLAECSADVICDTLKKSLENALKWK